MEHDLGDADKKRDLVKTAIEAAHHAGATASGTIPVVGPAVAVGLELLWSQVGDLLTSRMIRLT
jgi:hypothetical protein